MKIFNRNGDGQPLVKNAKGKTARDFSLFLLRLEVLAVVVVIIIINPVWLQKPVTAAIAYSVMFIALVFCTYIRKADEIG